MSLVNKSVNNIINGVSQQSPAIRLDNQLDEQINCYSDVTKGLVIRNGIELTNVKAIALTDTDMIEFTLDGEKIVMSLDPNAVTPLKHIPMSANVEELTGAIDNLSYFKNIQKGDIRVLEDKDRVYILNAAKKVGEIELGSAFVDVIVTNESTSGVDTSWVDGEYDLTLVGEEDPTTAAVAISSLTVTVDRTMTLSDITTLINADAQLVAEAGECYITGTVSEYRITFPTIPVNYIAPTITVLETVAIKNSFQEIGFDSGFVAENADTNTFPTTGVWAGTRWYYEGTFLADTTYAVTSINVGGFIYEQGANADQINKYIRKYQMVTVEHNYGVEVQTPDLSFDGNNLSSYAQEAMVWVTGVSSNQTYDVTIDYYDLVTTIQSTLTLTTINVGTTASQINLNWVAGQIQTQVNANADFTAVQYDNAIHITSLANKIISEITVTNNFDNSSISEVIEAVANSTSGTLDISTLPPLFIEGFKVRVGSEDVVGSNYYLTYSSDFNGWKESGLDSNRALDFLTMPQVIIKEDVRKTGIVTITKESWVIAASGDSDSNKSPSFVDKNVKDIFFYGSRLGLATDDTIVMSAINALDTFYRTTSSQTVTSDRVDIKLDSSKVGFDTIKHVTVFDQSLFVNTGTTQAKLLVNTSFDLTSARLTNVSAESLGSGNPLPVEGGLYFAISDSSYTNVINYYSAGNGKFETEDLTKHCPTYIEGTVDRMIYSKNLAVVSVNEDRQVLYIQNRFSKGGEMLQNAWHKWTLPYPLDHMYFFNDELKLIMSTDYNGTDYAVMGNYNPKPKEVSTPITGSATINWEPYLDLYTYDKTLIENFSEFLGIDSKNGIKYVDVATAYASTLVNQLELSATTTDTYDLSSPEYYWRVSGNTNTIVFNGGSAIVFGNNTLTEYDSGGYRYYQGADQGGGDYGVYRETITASSFYTTDVIYGIPFTARIILSQIISRLDTQNGPVVMNFSTIMLRRMRLFLSKSGPLTVTVSFRDRGDYTNVYNGQKLGTLLLGTGLADDYTYQFPTNGKSDAITITIETDSSTPFNLLATEWQGQLITKGRNI